jgi:ABC-type branched-subunit amino acid transport system ATPase component/ABC-type branched-subunit amino acid transport system permease subunit
MMWRMNHRPAVQWAFALLVIILPLFGDRYWLHLATLVAAFWTLIAGLNLVVGFTGQISVGHVGLLAVGAYLYAYLTLHGIVGPEVALMLAAFTGGFCGLILGLPSLRLPGFYFAMTTLAFTIIVAELSVSLTDITGGGTGLIVSGFSTPFDSPIGQYLFTAGIAGVVTLMTVLVTRSMWGRAMVSVRESEVMAAAVGIASYRVKLAVFTFSGVMAGLAGGLFGALQTYITPETFAFDLSLFFFICIIIGGRSSIIGPFIGTVILTLLPEVVAPLAKYSHLFYGVLLLAVVLLIPAGLGQFFTRRIISNPQDESPRDLEAQDLREIGRVVTPSDTSKVLKVVDVSRNFGAVKALQQVSLRVEPGTVHGLIGPNGSGKTTLLNILSGYYSVDDGSVHLGSNDISRMPVNARPSLGIGRTFQAPRVVPDLSVMDNIIVGGWSTSSATILEALIWGKRSRLDERKLRTRAHELLRTLGLESLSARPASSLTHAELRFVEIARALMHSPSFILLDEPASGLTHMEIDRLGQIIDRLRQQGIGVLLVEHHTELVFRISDTVTTLNFGRVISSGTAQKVQSDPLVRQVYLGA